MPHRNLRRTSLLILLTEDFLHFGYWQNRYGGVDRVKLATRINNPQVIQVEILDRCEHRFGATRRIRILKLHGVIFAVLLPKQVHLGTPLGGPEKKPLLWYSGQADALV